MSRPAELELRGAGLSEPNCALAVLAIGAGRSEQLSGLVREAFLRRAGVADLAPGRMALRLNNNRSQQLRDSVVDLTANLLSRAERIARQQARRPPKGTLRLPTRLHQRGQLLFSTGRGGTGDASLRPDQLTTVLAGTGIIGHPDGRWLLASRGQDAHRLSDRSLQADPARSAVGRGL